MPLKNCSATLALALEAEYLFQSIPDLSHAIDTGLKLVIRYEVVHVAGRHGALDEVDLGMAYAVPELGAVSSAQPPPTAGCCIGLALVCACMSVSICCSLQT